MVPLPVVEGSSRVVTREGAKEILVRVRFVMSYVKREGEVKSPELIGPFWGGKLRLATGDLGEMVKISSWYNTMRCTLINVVGDEREIVHFGTVACVPNMIVYLVTNPDPSRTRRGLENVHDLS